MLVKVVLVPPNKEYIYVQQVDGQRLKLERSLFSFASQGDVGYLVNDNGRTRLKLLTDDDDEVKLSYRHKQLVPYEEASYRPTVDRS